MYAKPQTILNNWYNEWCYLFSGVLCFENWSIWKIDILHFGDMWERVCTAKIRDNSFRQVLDIKLFNDSYQFLKHECALLQ